MAINLTKKERAQILFNAMATVFQGRLEEKTLVNADHYGNFEDPNIVIENLDAILDGTLSFADGDVGPWFGTT